MTKTAQAKLSAIATAAHKCANGNAETEAALKAHMGNKRVGSAPYAKAYAQGRETAIAGYMSGALGLSAGDNGLKAAIAVIGKAGHESTGQLKKGQGRRTKTEETAYTAARTWFSRRMKAAGIVSPDARGGAANGSAGGSVKAKRQGKAGQGKATPTVTPDDIKKGIANVAKKAPRNREEAYAFIEGTAAMLLQYINKNAAVVGGEVGQEVSRFKTAISATMNAEG